MLDGRWTPWSPYVPVARRRDAAARHLARLARRGPAPSPVVPRGRGRELATTFWGRAWCENLAAYAALANRLERGRRYLRSGLVIHLQVDPGAVRALVSGSRIYEVRVRVAPVPPARWRQVVRACAGKIDSVVELLAGRFDAAVMGQVSRQGSGLFPAPHELACRCTCPDGAGGGWVCKHVAATLYGVGVRLDEDPALLFRLRQVDPAALAARATARLAAGPSRAGGHRRTLAPDRLGAVFGIDLEPAGGGRGRQARPRPGPGSRARRA